MSLLRADFSRASRQRNHRPASESKGEV